MKNYIAVIITILFFICPSICFSSYLIELKNGSTFITNHYWKEGRLIKFYCRGGVVGIEKNLIREIRDSDLPYIVEKPQPEKAGEKTEAGSKEIDVEYYKNAKKDLMDKYRKTKNKLDKAIIDRDKIAKREAKKEIKEIHDKLSEFSSELKSENKGVLPKWW